MVDEPMTGDAEETVDEASETEMPPIGTEPISPDAPESDDSQA